MILRTLRVAARSPLRSSCPCRRRLPSRRTPPAKPPQGRDLRRLPRAERQLGRSRESRVLAGQTWRYIYLQLKDFKEGRRTDPRHDADAAKVLSRDEMIALGNWFAAQKPRPTGSRPTRAKVEAGRKIADAVLCPMCHLGGFVGQNEIPRVAGQHYEYIVKQLQDFKAKRRTNDAGNMTSVAQRCPTATSRTSRSTSRICSNGLAAGCARSTRLHADCCRVQRGL